MVKRSRALDASLVNNGEMLNLVGSSTYNNPYQEKTINHNVNVNVTNVEYICISRRNECRDVDADKAPLVKLYIISFQRQ